jgi:hypothetical protein
MEFVLKGVPSLVLPHAESKTFENDINSEIVKVKNSPEVEKLYQSIVKARDGIVWKSSEQWETRKDRDKNSKSTELTYAHNWKVSTIKDVDVLSEYQNTVFTGFPFAISRMWFILMCTFDNFEKSFFVKVWKFLYESDSNKVFDSNSRLPSLSVKKVKTGEVEKRTLEDHSFGDTYLRLKQSEILWNCALNELTHGYDYVMPAFMESTAHILVDPYWNWTDVKGISSPANLLFAHTPKEGDPYVPKWRMIPNETSLHRTGVMDQLDIGGCPHHYNRIIGDVRASMAKHDLPLCKKLMNDLMDGSFNDVTATQMAWARALHGPVGFPHGNQGGYLIDQTEKRVTTTPDMMNTHPMMSLSQGSIKKTYPIHPDMIEEGSAHGKSDCVYCQRILKVERNFFNDIEENDFHSYEKYVEETFSVVTNKSAGLNQPIPLDFTFKGETGKINAKTKAIIYASNPELFRNIEEIDRVMKEDMLIGTRDDKIRVGRFISMVMLHIILMEKATVSSHDREQAKDTSFSAFSLLGKSFVDNSRILETITQPHAVGGAYRLVQEADVSAMDLHTLAMVVLCDFVGQLRSLNKSPAVDRSFGPWAPQIYQLEAFGKSSEIELKGVVEMSKKLYDYITSVTFKSDPTRDRVFGGIRKELGGVKSGTLRTLSGHNTTNYAVYKVIQARVKREPKLNNIDAEIEFQNFTGDDAVLIWRFKSPPTEEEEDLLNKITIGVYEEVGLPISSTKTMLAPDRGEYLQKYFLRGVFIQHPNRISLSSERSGREDNLNIDFMSSVGSRIVDKLSRGGSSGHALLLRDMLVIHSTRILDSTRDKKGNLVKRKDVYLPFTISYLPRSMGGLGHSKLSMLVNAKDSFLLRELEGPQRGYALKIAAVFKPNLWKEELQANPLKIFPQLQRGVKDIDFYKRASVKRDAEAGVDRLLRQFQYVPKFVPYHQNAPNIVANAAESSPDLQRFKTSYVEGVKNAILKIRDATAVRIQDTEYGWTMYVDIEYGERLPDAIPPECMTPVAGPVGVVRNIYRVFPIGTNPSKLRSILGIIGRAISAAGVGGYLSADAVMEEIIKSGKFRSHEFIESLLTSYGFGSKHISQIANEIVVLEISPLTIQNFSGFSDNDSIISILDSSPSGLNHINVFGLSSFTKLFGPMLKTYGFLHNIMNHPEGKYSLRVVARKGFLDWFMVRDPTLRNQR